MNRIDGDGKTARGKAPVSRHPLFPAIVALWFGALFGLGSLAIRASLIEVAVRTTHIDAVFASAAPPLGMTARILLALALAAAGGALGAWIARRIAQPKQVQPQRKRNSFGQLASVSLRPRDAHPDAPARRPVSATEDFGSPSFDDQANGSRRRSLTIEEDYSPRDFDEIAPLPGHGVHVLDLAEIGFADAPVDAAQSFAPADIEYDPVEPVNFDDEIAAGHLATQDFQPSDADQPSYADAIAEFANKAAPVAAFELEGCEFSDDQAVRQSFAPEHDFEAAGDEPQGFDHPAAEPLPLSALADFVPEAGAAAPAAVALPTGSAAERIISASMDTLGPVELVERLALALQRKRMNAESPIEALPAAAAFAPPAPEPVLPPPMPALALPKAMQPVCFDDDADDADMAPNFLAPQRFVMPPMQDSPASAIQSFVAEPEADQIEPYEDAEDAAEEAADEAYSSLLDISAPYTPRQQFVRVEEVAGETGEIEPVVIFPGQSADTPRRFDSPVVAATAMQAASLSADSQDTERALRAALANLQRMSGAA